MTPPFPPEEPLRLQQHVPGAHIQGYPTAGPNARAVPLPEHLHIVARLEAERDAAVALAERYRRAFDALVTATHLAPDGRTRHAGVKSTCVEAACQNDGDDAVQLTPEERRAAGIEFHPRRVPMRKGEVA